jgi:hypothetical protein
MTLSGGLVALALALVTAQGPRVSGAKRSKPSALAVTSEKRVSQPLAPTPHPAIRSRPAAAAKRSAAAAVTPTPVPPQAADGATPTAADAAKGSSTTKTAKTNVYTFGAMDVEGKLKTPQLLYFLNRVKLELDMSAPDHRSFMKELAKTAEDPNL